MDPTPLWVKNLKPSGPQGSELLQQERDKSEVAVDRLAELLHTKSVLERQQRILATLESEEVFDKSQNHSLGRAERLKSSLAKAKRLRQLTEKHKWSQEDFAMANDLISEPTPYALHTSMFLVSFGDRMHFHGSL
jgi:acyl-CoA oxidase